METKQSELTKPQAGAHSVVIEGRRRVRITGVIDIESFHEDEATVLTHAGTLTLWGANMKLGKLDPDDGQVVLDGEVISLEYEQPEQAKRFSLFHRR